MAKTDSVADGDDTGAPAAKTPRFGKKQKIIAGAGAVLLLGGGGAAFMLLGGQKPDGEHAAEAAPPPAEAAHGGGEGAGEGGEALLVDVPAMIVNLRAPGGTPSFLKVHFMLVPSSAAETDRIKTRLPAIIDSYQPFLRELRPEDLSGSAAVFRLKEEMLVRAGAIVGPDAVSDVLIQDLVQQ